MIRARVHVTAVEITCPKCEQCVPAPNGSEFWTTEEVELERRYSRLYVVMCQTCEINIGVKMPKDVG